MRISYAVPIREAVRQATQLWISFDPSSTDRDHRHHFSTIPKCKRSIPDGGTNGEINLIPCFWKTPVRRSVETSATQQQSFRTVMRRIAIGHITIGLTLSVMVKHSNLTSSANTRPYQRMFQHPAGLKPIDAYCQLLGIQNRDRTSASSFHPYGTLLCGLNTLRSVSFGSCYGRRSRLGRTGRPWKSRGSSACGTIGLGRVTSETGHNLLAEMSTCHV